MAHKVIARCELVEGEDLHPGDFFSTAGDEYWSQALDGSSLGEKVYVRTNCPCPERERHTHIYQLTFTKLEEANPTSSPGRAQSVLMACGHVAIATDNQTGEPMCPICFDTPESRIPHPKPPDLSGRRARCSFYGRTSTGRSHESTTCQWHEPCLCEKPSDLALPFFSYRPDRDFDEFYCGCHGWD